MVILNSLAPILFAFTANNKHSYKLLQYTDADRRVGHSPQYVYRIYLVKCHDYY